MEGVFYLVSCGAGFVSSLQGPGQLRGPFISYPVVVFASEIKQLRHEANHSPTCGTLDENE
jgi:hypothetical protein